MKVLLYLVQNPPKMRIKAKAFGISQPLGAGYLASALQREGHQVQIFDHSVEDESMDAFEKSLLAFSPDLVGITTFTFAINSCFGMARRIKEILPQSKVVFGGPHATYLPEETVKDPCVDIVVVGEGESTLCELARALAQGTDLSEVRGIFYRKPSGEVMQTPERPLIADLDTIPFPAYDLMNMKRYYSSVNRRFTDKKFGSIITSRGCPHSCTFCSHKLFGKKIRMRSPENVVDEIEWLVKKHDIGEMIFLDDTFTVDTQRVLDICSLLQKRGLNIIWSCNTRADHASKELYEALYKAGCRGVHIGAESASQEMLDSMKKGIKVEQVVRAVDLAKKHIGHVVCGFILGLPGDTVERARQTIDFAKKLNPDYVTFNIAIPMPGSEIYEMALRKGLISASTAPWEDFLEMFSPAQPVLELSEIPRDQLVSLAKQGFREFYFRPGYILYRLSKLNSPWEIFQYWRGLMAILNYEFMKRKNV